MSTLDSLIPGTQPATDVVTRKVFIDAVEISNEIMLSTITVNKSFNKVAYAKLTFIDGSVSERDFELSNSDRFKPGKIIKVQLGYHGQVDTVFEGIIVKHGIKVRSTGASQLLIEAKDKAIKSRKPIPKSSLPWQGTLKKTSKVRHLPILSWYNSMPQIGILSLLGPRQTACWFLRMTEN